MVLIKCKISGATLQETIIALTIVLICFSVALAVFINVLSCEQAWVKLNSDLLIKQISCETKKNKTYFDEWIDVKQYQIEKTVTQYNGHENLLQLHLKVFIKNGRLINQRIELLVDYQSEREVIEN